MEMTNTVLTALGLTVAAASMMIIGAVAAMFIKTESRRFRSCVLGISGGLMLSLAFFEMLPEGFEALGAEYESLSLYIITAGVFAGGILLLWLVDTVLPHHKHSHDNTNVCMQRTGIMMAIFIGIHNFPEGMAMFVASMDGFNVAFPLLLGVALHNIPEGFAIYTPMYCATHKKSRGLWLTVASALGAPLGAITGILFLLPYWSEIVNGYCLTAVAGMMTYLCVDELIPISVHENKRVGLLSILIGCAVMFLLLIH